jgi:hypothetical protein
MDRCQLFADDWTMPGRTTEVCGCGNPARNHPRKPNLVTQPGNYFKSLFYFAFDEFNLMI